MENVATLLVRVGSANAQSRRRIRRVGFGSRGPSTDGYSAVVWADPTSTHGVAVEVLKQRDDLEEVRALLGHARIDTNAYRRDLAGTPRGSIEPGVQLRERETVDFVLVVVSVVPTTRPDDSPDQGFHFQGMSGARPGRGPEVDHS